MFFEVKRLLRLEKVEAAVQAEQDYIEKFDHLQEVELEVVDVSSHGEGLAINDEKDWIVAVPFCVPGERVLARVYRNDRMHSYADLVEIVRRSEDKVEWRDDSRIGCKYFGKCSGCQYQMLSYEKQLELKRNIVVKAYQNFSHLSDSLVPEIGPTLPSPQQYGYRTKLTPHFDAPKPDMIRNNGEGFNIGFQQKGRRIVLDIEECPIGTPAINQQMTISREETKKNMAKYKRGATILLRDSLPIDIPIEDQVESGPTPDEKHVCITDHHAVVRERVADKMFTFSANSFFQNNNDILRSLVECIRDILPSDEQDSYLVDTYCGSGLFAITLAEKFKEVAGVEISSESIKYAKLNAEINGLKNIRFIAGSAEAIFEGLTFDASKTTILIDPPRKGCDELFLKQLLAFSPKRIVYVSCNVHTQARDVGYIVKQSGERYKVDSVRGCDLFPQTYHVEALAVLSQV
ncbi:S-adenosyl-L-methionine-dependent methyltransferase [Cystobasidium minutum MCA 4210]|uniref:S-adenosyl-L-methionine-dependent methyltransferase n=1 Tax=Cystobasidium minutum MCA 4210 TaxID=1397322 RepID=UPI0034CF6F4C|eukprot:jgi/Rhomi1/144999/e_gw1.4.516.1